MANRVEITQPPLSPQAVADLLCTIMLLCQGENKDGKPFWAYMCIKPSMAKAFKEARDGGQLDLEDYGTILEQGEGRAVPSEVQQRMERDYGINHRYEQELLAAIHDIERKHGS